MTAMTTALLIYVAVNTLLANWALRDVHNKLPYHLRTAKAFGAVMAIMLLLALPIALYSLIGVMVKTLSRKAGAK
jgi:uncharacterized membrane protein YdjX (TVP38/TMEM64 family)